MSSSGLKFFSGSVCFMTQRKLCNLPRVIQPWRCLHFFTCCSFSYSLGPATLTWYHFFWQSRLSPSQNLVIKYLTLWISLFSIICQNDFYSSCTLWLIFQVRPLAIRPINSPILWKSLKIIYKLNNNSNILRKRNIFMSCYKIHTPF